MKKKAKKRNMSRAAKILIAAAAVTAVAAAAVFAVFFSPLFSINNIEVQPLEHYPEERISSFLKDYIGKNGFRAVIGNSSLHQTKSFFSLELVEAEEKILFACPYLESVTVKFRPGHTVSVSAEERKSAFLTEFYDLYLLCDTHGVVLETFTRETVPEELPIVKGITPGDYKLGRSISDGRNDNIDTAIRFCRLLSQLDMESYIDIVDVSDYNNIRLYCAPSLTVIFGSMTDAGVKLSLTKGVMDKGVDGNSNATVTVADGRQATFVKNSGRED